MNKKEAGAQWLLLLAVFVIATCGLIYELVAGTQASYLLGDSVTQFSTIIGVYLFAMGVGSYLSRFFNHNLLQWFIKVELLVGLVGGCSAAVLFIIFPLASAFRIVLYAFVFLTGLLVGLEIPLLMRILKDKVEFKELVSRVFTFDYIGALLASLIFPLVLVPYLGLIRTSLFFGILNISVGWYLAWYFRNDIRNAGWLRSCAIMLLVIELAAFVYADKLMTFSETMTFNDNVVYARSSPYQRIVLTRNRRETRLFLNGNLQFSTADEYRYHEALVHPAMSSVDAPEKVLVLGGGDGLATREILKYPSVKHVTLVDLDEVITDLFTTQEGLIKINKGSLADTRVTVINKDAFSWLKDNKQKFDVVVVDFPDPSAFSIGKLYSTVFYKLLHSAMKDGSIAVVQSTSPYVAPKSFWCIDTTLHASGFLTQPYHNYVPSFGEWGYIIAYKNAPEKWFHNMLSSTRYLNTATLQQMFIFPEDMKAHVALQPNRLNNQSLVNYFEEEWGKYVE